MRKVLIRFLFLTGFKSGPRPRVRTLRQDMIEIYLSEISVASQSLLKACLGGLPHLCVIFRDVFLELLHPLLHFFSHGRELRLSLPALRTMKSHLSQKTLYHSLQIAIRACAILASISSFFPSNSCCISWETRSVYNQFRVT